MPYTLALQLPEAPVSEEWVWTTDVNVSYSGEEDRIPLNRYPRRRFSGEYVFDDAQSIRRHLALMFTSYRALLQLPLYQYRVKPKAPMLLGDVSIPVNTLRSDFRVGQSAFIIEGAKYEVLEVDTLTEDSVTFTTGLLNDYSTRAIVCPLTEVYALGTGSLSRFNTDEGARATYSFEEYKRWPGIVSEFNTETLTMFDGMPVLEMNAKGTQFDATIGTGLTINDAIGLVDLSTSWAQSKTDFALQWQASRMSDLSFWNWWLVFADHVQGSCNEFLLPSHREDLVITSTANGGEDVISVATNIYSQHYWPLDTFARIVIRSSVGSHYATVTNVTAFTGVDTFNFDPPLPAGAGWDIDQRIEFLTKVRIADDRIKFVHYGLHTDVSLLLRTVP